LAIYRDGAVFDESVVVHKSHLLIERNLQNPVLGDINQVRNRWRPLFCFCLVSICISRVNICRVSIDLELNHTVVHCENLAGGCNSRSDDQIVNSNVTGVTARYDDVVGARRHRDTSWKSPPVSFGEAQLVGIPASRGLGVGTDCDRPRCTSQNEGFVGRRRGLSIRQYLATDYGDLERDNTVHHGGSLVDGCNCRSDDQIVNSNVAGVTARYGDVVSTRRHGDASRKSSHSGSEAQLVGIPAVRRLRISTDRDRPGYASHDKDFVNRRCGLSIH